MNKSFVQLKTDSILNVPFQMYRSDEFIFEVNGQIYKTSQIISDLLSPIISRLHSNDPTFNRFVINTTQKGDFQHILNLINFEKNLICETEIEFLTEVLQKLGNKYIEISYQEQNMEINSNNVFIHLNMHLKYPNYFTSKIQKEIDFISSHFYELYDNKKKEKQDRFLAEIMQLDVAIVEFIMLNSKLKLKDENQLLDFVNRLYSQNPKYSVLYENVDFRNVDLYSINKFIEIYDIEDLTKLTWKKISERLQQESKDSVFKESKRYIKIDKNQESNQEIKIEENLDKNDEKTENQTISNDSLNSHITDNNLESEHDQNTEQSNAELPSASIKTNQNSSHRGITRYTSLNRRLNRSNATRNPGWSLVSDGFGSSILDLSSSWLNSQSSGHNSSSDEEATSRFDSSSSATNQSSGPSFGLSLSTENQSPGLTFGSSSSTTNQSNNFSFNTPSSTSSQSHGSALRSTPSNANQSSESNSSSSTTTFSGFGSSSNTSKSSGLEPILTLSTNQPARFTFGSSSSPNTNQPTGFTFGSSSSPNTNQPTGFTFGSSSSPNTNQPTGFTFGSSSSPNTNQPTGFTFGSSSSPNTNQPTGFTFGSSSSPYTNQPTGFTFGSSSSSNTNQSTGFTFGSSSSPYTNQPTGFTFGSSSSPNTNQPTGFTFGSSSSPNTNQSTGFTFGSSSSPNTNQPTGFTFGSSSSTTSQSNSFSFTSTTKPSSQARINSDLSSDNNPFSFFIHSLKTTETNTASTNHSPFILNIDENGGNSRDDQDKEKSPNNHNSDINNSRIINKTNSHNDSIDFPENLSKNTASKIQSAFSFGNSFWSSNWDSSKKQNISNHYSNLFSTNSSLKSEKDKTTSTDSDSDSSLDLDKIIGSDDEYLENKNHNQDESNNSSSAESSWTPPKGKPVNDSQDESSANSNNGLTKVTSVLNSIFFF